MSALNRTLLAALSDQGNGLLGQGRQVGLEKESLRVDRFGSLSESAHPRALGAPLTHPTITTDFAESMLEFATAPSSSVQTTLDNLDQAHRFVAQVLADEGQLLWAGSMPCRLTDPEQRIVVANYGSSHSAQLKAAYRRGLAARYGKPMQVICGIHFNYSLGEAFWQQWGQCHGHTELQAARSAGYLHVIRNLQRWAWVIPYFFGATPALDASFVEGTHHDLQRLGADTLYGPYATSLRMGDLGYSNNRQGHLGFRAGYDSLLTYTNSLAWAMNRYVPSYADIGLYDQQGQRRQLSANQLQVENEYYSLARPKPAALSGERPVSALRRAGVSYLELRPTDVDLRLPLGMSVEQLQFYEIMVVAAALCDSPMLRDAEVQANGENMARITSRGREPGLRLFTPCYRQQSVAEAGTRLLDLFSEVAALLDDADGSSSYSAVLPPLLERLQRPDLTPSATILAELIASGQSFEQLSLAYAKAHQAHFLDHPLSPEQTQAFEADAREAWQALAALESKTSDTSSFERYLQNYLQQVPAE